MTNLLFTTALAGCAMQALAVQSTSSVTSQITAEFMQAGTPDPYNSLPCPDEQCPDRNMYLDHRDCVCKPLPRDCDFNQVWDSAVNDCVCVGICDEPFIYNFSACACQCNIAASCP